VTVSHSLRSDSGLAKLAVVLGVGGLVLLGGTGAVLLNASGGSGDSVATGGADGPTPTPAPVVAVVAGSTGSTVPWQRPLTFSVTHGTLTLVQAADADGTTLTGTLTPTSWTSTSTLIPGHAYALHADVRNSAGKASALDRRVTAAAATSLLKATVSPDGGTFGIGQAVIVRFNHSVGGRISRQAVQDHLKVTTTPEVRGAWHWYNSFEVHYRGPAYWTPGTTIKVTAALAGVHLPGTETWGATDAVSSHYSIGEALVATVDVTAHIMTVRRSGSLVRTVKVSTGRDKYPTKGGVHVVLVREQKHLYDSATVGIPTASPDGYYEYLPWSVRISNGGAFVHANPATTRVQGVANVSHGCVNTSIVDAKWFYDNSKLGDIVNVIHAAVPPNTGDEGMADWNYTWAQWTSGDLSG
jgi:lipoprotein-anchoring transpeptidase ErfK/SrfK